MRAPHQLTLLEVSMLLDQMEVAESERYGEVFTRRWVVEFILDLVGYRPEDDLGGKILIEPSCGTGAFLVPAIERLVKSALLHGRALSSLGQAIRAFDLQDVNASITRKAAVTCLVDAGLDTDAAEDVGSQWIIADDFLLREQADASADFVVGNPPYIRLEDVPAARTAEYRRRCPTMRGRADIYVGFIERGLHLLRTDGRLGFICADRWMRNQYGASLRELISRHFAVDLLVGMHDVDAFENEVSAYPAVIVLRRGDQHQVRVVEATQHFDAGGAASVSRWADRANSESVLSKKFSAAQLDGWFDSGDLWPTASPSQLELLRRLEARFGPLEDPSTGARVGIGLATGCDSVFITDDAELVEEDRLLPLLQAGDIAGGEVSWSGRFLVNPWNGHGLVELDQFPRLRDYFAQHEDRLRRRHVARRRPAEWFRTIDRLNPRLLDVPRLVLPDLKAAAHPVLDEGRHYPHHNLYWVFPGMWDPEVLGGLLLSGVANLFVGAYCVKMRGGCYRFQAQYVRRIRVPRPDSISPPMARALAAAFRSRDAERATGLALRAYDLDAGALIR